MGAVLVAIAASIGCLLQGWDNATIAGAILYIKKEFNVEGAATMEGLLVAMSLIGAAIITTFTGAISDSIGRRPMLIISSVLYFLSGIIMLWSPNIYVLLAGRLIDGFGMGLVVTIVPIYISETSPSEIRGLLNTVPQFTGCTGMFISYCIVFGMSLMAKPNWKMMLGFLSIPSILYFALTLLYLPESPRWLVSKGRMVEARRVLQRLRGSEDVSGEMALLVEGLSVSGESSIEKYLIGPANELPEEEETAENEKIILYGIGDGQSWVARPVREQSILGSTLRLVPPTIPLMDPLVTLFGSVHEKIPEMGSMRSVLFPNFGSMFSVAGQELPEQSTTEQWDEENVQHEGEDNASDSEKGDSDDNLQTPLISQQTTSMEGPGMVPTLSMRRDSSIMQGSSSMGIGVGWQLAWKWSERGGFKRIYLHQKSAPGITKGSSISLLGVDVQGSGVIQAAALVNEPTVYSKKLMEQHPVGPAMTHPSETTTKGPRWGDLFDTGVKHALLLGIGIQLLQQFAGINGVLYYTPQILEKTGIRFLLANIGITSDSVSILISALITLLMLPSIGVAMRLMDMSGRRSLLLGSIPVLIVALVVLVIASLVSWGNATRAVLSTISFIVYICTFVVGFGPVPSVLCAEIFPTRVRGICMGICTLTMWIGGVIVTFTLPVLLNAIGLAGVFGISGIVCILALAFVFLKVPETKGMPLEVIAEFFAFGSKKVVIPGRGELED